MEDARAAMMIMRIEMVIDIWMSFNISWGKALNGLRLGDSECIWHEN